MRPVISSVSPTKMYEKRATIRSFPMACSRNGCWLHEVGECARERAHEQGTINEKVRCPYVEELSSRVTELGVGLEAAREEVAERL
jgi:hypothetical protein